MRSSALVTLLLSVLSNGGLGDGISWSPGRSVVAAPAVVDSMPVPMEHQVNLILKILTYDRNLESRSGPDVRIGIVYFASDPGSVRARNEIADVLQRFGDRTVNRLHVRYTPVEFVSETQFESAVKAAQINMLYITPGNTRNIDAVVRLSQRQKILTATGVPQYVERGIAVGIDITPPNIMINLPSSKAAGSQFDASLLHIARIVR